MNLSKQGKNRKNFHDLFYIIFCFPVNVHFVRIFSPIALAF